MVHGVGMMAGYEIVDRFELVDEPIDEQKIECPVDRLWHGDARFFAYRILVWANAIKQVISFQWRARFGYQSKHAGTNRSQAQATLVT